ncbi:MAG: hypothetical protein NVS3B25_15390 [Hymenobacter sp.]
MLLPLPDLLGLVLLKLRESLRAQLPVSASADASVLTIGTAAFRITLVERTPAVPVSLDPTPAAPPALPSIAVAEYIPRLLAERLRHQGQYYADAMGNAWLEAAEQGLTLLLSGARSRKLPVVTNQAFQLQGLRLVFYLLVDPDLVQLPNLVLARRTRLPLPAVNDALLDLTQQGFVLEEHGRHLVNRAELLARWVTGYGGVLRPHLPVQRYRWLNGWQRKLAGGPLEPKSRLWWGGAAAARRLLGCSTWPTAITLYTHSLNDSPRWHQMGLAPHPSGPVEVVQLFPQGRKFSADHCVHPLLVYADLVLAGDHPSARIAHQLRQRYLSHLTP